MRIVEICSSPVFVADPDQALAAAARDMRARQIGALVVVAPGDRRQRPLEEGLSSNQSFILKLRQTEGRALV